MPMSPQLTITESDAWPEPSFVVVTLAVLFTVEHDVLSVPLVMCTCLLAPEAKSPHAQVSVPAEIEQPGLLFAPSIVQLVPGVVGSGSLTFTPRAIPAPALVAVTTNPI